jgi:Tol biopolymer transport system component
MGQPPLVSVNISGVAGGNGDSLPVDVSTNGQFVVFESSASDLVQGDTNNTTDVFVRDLASDITILVSANTNGVPGNGASHSSAMTPDGRYVAFVSSAGDLVAATPTPFQMYLCGICKRARPCWQALGRDRSRQLRRVRRR